MNLDAIDPIDLDLNDNCVIQFPQQHLNIQTGNSKKEKSDIKWSNGF
jgi:hypothetical protein